MTKATIDNTWSGTKLIADGGFACIPAGRVLTVKFDEAANDLFAPCAHGKYFLDGQLNDDLEFVGFFLMEPTA